MAIDPEIRRLQAKQVGMLMRAYRHAFIVDGRARRLSQDGLLDLMAQVNRQYSERHDHSTVTRWESGATRPTRARIEVFGQALNLSAIEVDGLIRLAGLKPDDPVPAGGRQSLEESANTGAAVSVDTLEYPGPAAAASAVGEGDSPSYAWEVIRYCLSRFFLPGSGVAVAGYVLASLGWSATWMLMLYVSIAIGLVLVQGFLRLRRSNDLRELFFISVFFVLSAPLLQVPLLRMDHYEFYAIGNLANTPIPVLLALAFNLLLALACGLLFEFLWRWQYSGRGAEQAYKRAAWVVLPPVGLVYACILALSNVGAWIEFLLLLTVLAGVFTMLAVLRDQAVSLSEWDRKFLLGTAVAVTIVLTILGSAAILAAYLEPSLLAMPGHTLLHSGDIDFNALGYPPEELTARFRVGFVWASLAMSAYMVFVIGGNLIVTIYRLGGGESAQPATDTALAGTGVSLPPEPSRRARVDARYWAGCLAGLRTFRPGCNRTGAPSN